MNLKTFLRNCLMEYFVITTCVTAGMAILGQAIDPTRTFGYEAYWSPLIFGLVGVVPSLVTYSRKELTFRQALVRKVIHIIVLEATLVLFGFAAGLLHVFSDTSLFMLEVFIIYLAVNLIGWQLDKKSAGEINQMLKSLQGRSER